MSTNSTPANLGTPLSDSMHGTIVFVGAGGTGLSAVVLLLHQLGYRNIVAINNVENQITRLLADRGINVIIGHGKYEVQHEDQVIYSDVPAIRNGPELMQSRKHMKHPHRKRHHRPRTYNAFLAELSKRFITVGVTGSNGKTSITGMLIHALPSLHDKVGLGIVGGILANSSPRQNFFLNTKYVQDIQSIVHSIFVSQGAQDKYVSLHKRYFLILEACEYKDHFLLYDMDYSIISTIDYDHEDYFPNYTAYIESFVRMIQRTKRTVICQPQTADKLLSYAAGNKQLTTQLQHKLSVTSTGKHTGKQSEKYILPPQLFGEHYQENAASIMHLSTHIQKDFPSYTKDKHTGPTQIRKTYKGIGRRMECLVNTEETILYSDYSHHAPALEKNYYALREKFPTQTLTLVFQPHMVQRVYQGWAELSRIIKLFDKRYIFRPYSVREDIASFDRHSKGIGLLDNEEDVGKALAHEVQGEYISQGETIVHTMLHIPQIIFLATAGDLDFKLRNLLTDYKAC